MSSVLNVGHFVSVLLCYWVNFCNLRQSIFFIYHCSKDNKYGYICVSDMMTILETEFTPDLMGLLGKNVNKPVRYYWRTQIYGRLLS